MISETHKKNSEKIIELYKKQSPKLIRTYDEFEGVVNAATDKIFPLLCPTIEADWIPGWDAELIYTQSGYAEDKCIFKTSAKNQPNNEQVWMIINYQPNTFINLIRFEINVLTFLEIRLEEAGKNKTLMHWKYTFTALNEKGNNLLTKKEDAYGNHSSVIQLINIYLKKIIALV